MNELEKRGAKRPCGYVRSDGSIWRGDHWISPEKLEERRSKDAERKRIKRSDLKYLEKERESRRRHYYKHQPRLLKQKRESCEELKRVRAEKARIWRAQNSGASKELSRISNQKRRSKDAIKTLSQEEKAEKQARELARYAEICQNEKRQREARRPNAIIASRMRTRLRAFLTREGKYKAHNTMFYVGCTHEQLRMHIESQFKHGMTWGNYGKVWHIDHIVPVSLFGTDEDELKRATNWQNLRPLWARQNIVEGNRRQNNQTVLPLTLA